MKNISNLQNKMIDINCKRNELDSFTGVVRKIYQQKLGKSVPWQK